MPLIGFNCPGEPWSQVTIKDCEACDHKCLPIEILRLIWKWGMPEDGHYHSNPMVISVTEAIGCLRKAFYNKTLDYTEEAEALLPRVRGSIFHKAIEDCQPDDMSEVGLGCDLTNGYTLMGSVDRLSDRIKDWKTCARPKKTYHDNEAMQLNVYEQMSRSQGGMVKEIVQVGLEKGTDGNRVAVHQVHEIEDALDKIKGRANKLVAALVAGDVEMLDKEGLGIKFYI
jgi:hypothetical protein